MVLSKAVFTLQLSYPDPKSRYSWEDILHSFPPNERRINPCYRIKYMGKCKNALAIVEPQAYYYVIYITPYCSVTILNLIVKVCSYKREESRLDPPSGPGTT